MPKGGHRFQRTERRLNVLTVTVDHVRLTVKDSGTGIPDDIVTIFF
jgi:signal transduction histidine kinase